MIRLSGSVKLSCACPRARQTPAVAPTSQLSIGAARLVVIVLAASALGVHVALALLQQRSCRDDRVEPVLAASDLDRGVQLGLVLLGLIGHTCLGKKITN